MAIDSCSIVAALDRNARAAPGALAFRYLDESEVETAHLTHGALGAAVRRVAQGLRARGAAGTRVLLLYPQGLDFAVAFHGTLAAGAVAVPAPGPQRSALVRARLIAAARDAAPQLVLTAPEHVAEVRAMIEEGGGAIPVATLGDLAEAGAEEVPPTLPDPGDLALIQYTSGSTSAPKGVMITHGNLAANQRLIAERFGHGEDTVFASWLPMYHDMGLIGHMIQPVWLGVPSTLMSPSAFLIEPGAWLRAISRYGATTSGAPNFAYDFCVSRIPEEEREGLDLSRWSVAYNGSEPIRAGTLERFAAAFAPQGFRPSALYPCYGMAEATLFMTGMRPGAGPKVIEVPAVEPGAAPLRHVGSGATGEGHEVLIVDPETRRPLPEGETGEIWFRGPSVTQGYWRRPDLNAETVGAVPEGRAERFLRTGDLGFLAGGEIFVTGRIKDVLIVRGRNHYPQDIEATAQAAHPALRADAGAAFSVEGPRGPEIVLAQEVVGVRPADLDAEGLAGAIRAAVAAEHGLRVATVVLLRVGAIPKTSSGKIQRALARTRHLAGELPALAVSGARPLEMAGAQPIRGDAR